MRGNGEDTSKIILLEPDFLLLSHVIVLIKTNNLLYAIPLIHTRGLIAKLKRKQITTMQSTVDHFPYFVKMRVVLNVVKVVCIDN